jgi:Flp pilus assembly pilin Flp
MGFLEADGQDTVEYTLILALAVLTVAGIVVVLGGGIEGIWTQGQSVIEAGSQTATGGS